MRRNCYFLSSKNLYFFNNRSCILHYLLISWQICLCIHHQQPKCSRYSIPCTRNNFYLPSYWGYFLFTDCKTLIIKFISYPSGLQIYLSSLVSHKSCLCHWRFLFYLIKCNHLWFRWYQNYSIVLSEMPRIVWVFSHPKQNLCCYTSLF